MKCFWGSFASSLSILCLLYLFFSSSSFQAASAGQAGGGSSVADYLTEDLFEAILKNRNDPICPARGFYTYESFLEAAKNFSDFGTTGDQEERDCCLLRLNFLPHFGARYFIFSLYSPFSPIYIYIYIKIREGEESTYYVAYYC